MAGSEEFFLRRKKVVPDGIGIFNKTTAISAKGSRILDAEERDLLDFGTGIGVTALGHCPPSVSKAISEQAKKLIHGCFHVSTYEPYLDLCEKLVFFFPHGKETKAMLTNTGAEAVENAVKIARQATGRQAIICFTGAFHGRTMMAMSLTSKVSYKVNCGPFAPEVYRLPFPNYYKYRDDFTLSEFVQRELMRFRDALTYMVEPSNVAAVIIEPILGEGGFIPVPSDYMEGLRALCDQYGILLIIDEVQSGFCRTGEWGAYQHYKITPDLSTWAKAMGSGMPIGAVIGKQEVMDAAKPGTIGGTYLGNPVSCAAALATIEYMDKHNLCDKATEIGKVIRDCFRRLKTRCSSIGDVRGLGAMMAFELVKNKDPNQPDGELSAKLVHSCLERGLIILTAGTFKNVIRVLCPLTISNEDLDKGLTIIEEELVKLTG